MNRNGPGPMEEQPNDGADEAEPEFFDFTDMSRRTKNMHDPKLILEIGSYVGVFTAVAGDITAKVATEALGGEAEATLFNVARLKPGSKDLVAFPTRAKGPATMEATWPDNMPGGRLDLQYLLQVFPVKIPKGHRAFVPVGRHSSPKYGPGIILKFSEISYGRITPRSRPAGQNANSDKGKKAKKNPPPRPEGAGDQQGA